MTVVFLDYRVLMEYGGLSSPAPILWGPAKALVIFDVVFFSNYAIGWLLTYKFNPDFIDDNAVTRVFKVYNICIGVDSFPARPVAVLLGTFSLIAFAFACYLHWLKTYFDGGMPRWLATVWLASAFLLGLCFMLSFAVPPEGLHQFMIHCLAFAVGLIGYLLLKAFAVAEYYIFVGWSSREWKGLVYVWTLIPQILFMGFMVGVLITSLVHEDLQPLLDGPVPDHIEQDTNGAVLIFLAMIGPPLQWLCAPHEVDKTVIMSDATPNSALDAA